MTNFEQLLSVIKNHTVYVQMHNYPDQDAIASAFALKTLLEASGLEAFICYKGRIDKFNTLKMLELLEIDTIPIQDIELCPSDEIIIVDGQKGNVNVEEFTGEVIACIDHHTIQNTVTYRFFDIRSQVGSCSTILAYYFVENKREMPQNVATALLYGLKVDTSNLSRGVSDLDTDMFSFLYKKADNNILRRLDTCSLRRDDLQAYIKAISGLRLYGNVGIANIGNDCSEAIIGTISDFLLTLSEVDFSLVYSYRAGGLKFSLRNELPHLDASRIIKQALSGLGDGGGHASMAAGFVPDIQEKDIKPTALIVEHRVIELVLE